MHFRLAGRRGTAATLALATMLAVSEALVPVAVHADTGGTNTIKVLDAPTINPAATGGSFTVRVVANGSVVISGAASGLAFDNTKLQLTALAKNATLVTAGAGYGGFPSSANLASFIATANTNGQIPNIGYFYTDGTSDAANSDITIFTATFSVIAIGDVTLTPNTATKVLDGQVATYGQPLATTTVNGTVTNTAPPAPATAAITKLAPQLTTNLVPVKWSGTGTGTLTYDVQYRKAPYTSSVFGALTAWQTGVSTTAATFTTVPGFTYCFSSRTHDDNGVSGWTAETCTAAPLDDRSFTKSGTWSAKTGSAFYRSTYMYSTTSGAKLTRTGVKTKRIALVATTCSTCGYVKVTFAGATKTISLKSTTTVNKKVIAVFTYTSIKSSTLTIAVYGSGKKIYIDGVVLGAR